MKARGGEIGHAFFMEAMGTALLVYVVLETAVNTKSVVTDGTSMIRGQKQTLAPIPIGFAVFAAHVLCVPVTGCSINPTRSFGPALVSDTCDGHCLATARAFYSLSPPLAWLQPVGTMHGPRPPCTPQTVTTDCLTAARRTHATLVCGTCRWDDHWLFWIAPLSGALMATLVCLARSSRLTPTPT
jgi:glycerol uptake facilitator-like aquaporin